MTITQVPAHPNNYGLGRVGKTPNKIIVHWIVGTLQSADATFKNPDRLASAHYGIENGIIHQYVKEEDTAWHASNLTINRESIGIEHSGGWDLGNGQRAKPTEETHKTSALLIADICKRYSIPIDKDHILPHNNFSATQCPGSLDIDKLISLAKGVDTTMTIEKKVFEELIGKLDKQEKQLATLLAENNKLASQLNSSDNELTKEREEHKKLDVDIQELESLVTSRNDEIGTLKKDLASTPVDGVKPDMQFTLLGYVLNGDRCKVFLQSLNFVITR